MLNTAEGASSMRARRSRNCFRASNVLVLIQASPPGQPLTFGGENRFWPIPADTTANGMAAPGLTSSWRSVPTTSSTGLLTSVPRLSLAQNASERKRARSAAFTS